MRIGLEIEQLFDRSPLEELALHRVEPLGPVLVPPVVEGQLPVAVVVLQAVGIVALVVANVLPAAFSEGTHHVEFLVEPVGVTEHFVAAVQVGCANAVAEERYPIEFLMRLNAGQVEYRRAEVNEAHEPIRATAALVIDELFEILRDAHNKWHVQATLVGVALAARQHAAVIAKIKHERILQQTVLPELIHDAPDMAVDDTHSVVVACHRVTHDRRVWKVRRQINLSRQGGCRLLQLFYRKVKRAFVRVSERLHVEERHRLVRPIAPGRLAGRHVPRLLHVDLEVVVGL